MITCKVYLKDPYNYSFQTLLRLCQLKRLKLISGSTSASANIIKMDLKYFMKFTGQKPVINKKYNIPNGATGFMTGLQVIKIQD